MSAVAPLPTPQDELTYGQRLEQAREAAGLSKRAAALAFGVDRSAIRQWETDTTLVSAARQPLVEDALGLEPGTLGAWVRHSPLYLATLPPAPPSGAIPGYLYLITSAQNAA